MAWTASDIPPQKGRFAIVTGVGGLGYETALELARAGAEVVLAGRNPEKGRVSVDRIRAAVPQAVIRFEMLDLASLASIADFSARMLATRKPLDILVNNAGVMAPPARRVTADGFELQFGTNHLGHFALTVRLLPLLLLAKAPRVVSVSSLIHRGGAIAFDDLQAERAYKPGRGYAQSKLANLMFALELQRRATAAGSALMSNAAHPGVAGTDLFANSRDGKGVTVVLARAASALMTQSAAAGALPTLYAATSADARGGGYYGPRGFSELMGLPTDAVIAPQAKDETVARRLWTVSEELTGVKPSFAPLA